MVWILGTGMDIPGVTGEGQGVVLLLAGAIGLLVTWGVLRSAVRAGTLSALRTHAREQARERGRHGG